ncbi:MAG TPA: TetR/AcrR family transcriptional regulator [Ardenticatenaceae bacterium]|jgi:AcrR family transcriptional regulator
MTELSRRDELLAKAARLFREKGYHATTMKDIAADLEILPGSLYHHIDSKESLLLEIMQRGIEVLLARVRPVVNSELAPTEKLKQIVHIHIASIADYPDVLAVFLHELKSIPEGRRSEQKRLRDEYDHLLRSVLEEGIAQGSFRPLDSRMVTFAVLGMLNWLYAWYRPSGGLSPAEIAEHYCSIVLYGIATSQA